MNERGRRMAWHGVLLFFLSMLEGAAVSSLANPRMALSAHVGGAMSGMFLFMIGLAGLVATWLQGGDRDLSGRPWSGFYLSAAGLVLAAAMGTHNSTPLNGLAGGASPLREALVTALLTIGAGGVLLACVLLLWGLRRRGI